MGGKKAFKLLIEPISKIIKKVVPEIVRENISTVYSKWHHVYFISPPK